VNALLDVPGGTPVPVLVAALAPKMLKLAGSRTEGTITWMADERSIEEYVVPRLLDAAMEAGRGTPRVVAGLPLAVCDDADEGRERAARLFSVYGAIPTYQRILATGDADDPAEVCVVGTESQVRMRLEAFRDAGVTDLAASTFAVGDDRVASAALTSSSPRSPPSSERELRPACGGPRRSSRGSTAPREGRGRGRRRTRA
jgi:5,10-methylenetetrahydromethanopterin reductase